jgi:hypothetical protein
MPIPADKTTLSPPKLKRNYKVTEGYGIKGAFCVYTGEGLATFDATFEFWDENKEVQWNLWAALFLPPPSRTLVDSAALGIHHPALIAEPFRITNAQVTDIEGWSLVTPGKWQTRLSFLQYRPPEPFKPIKTEPVVPPPPGVPVVRPSTAQELRAVAAQARLVAAVAATPK